MSKEPWRATSAPRDETEIQFIRPDAIVFANDVMVIGLDIELPDMFWLHLAEVIPPILFQKLKWAEREFVAIEPPEDQPEAQPLHLLPRVCLQGVWWTRRAAIEADQCISAFRAGSAPWKQRSLPQSGS